MMTTDSHERDHERNHERDLLLNAIGLDNSTCDLNLDALAQKVATQRRDLVQRWGTFEQGKGSRRKLLIIEEENGNVWTWPVNEERNET